MKTKIELMGIVSVLRDNNLNISVELAKIQREMNEGKDLNIDNLVELVNKFCGLLATIETD